MRPQSQQQFDQCDQWKRNKGRAQSKPTHTKGIRSRLDTGQRPVPKLVFISSKRVSFLFPSNLFSIDILEGKLREGQTVYVEVKNGKLEFKEK